MGANQLSPAFFSRCKPLRQTSCLTTIPHLPLLFPPTAVEGAQSKEQQCQLSLPYAHGIALEEKSENVFVVKFCSTSSCPPLRGYLITSWLSGSVHHVKFLLIPHTKQPLLNTLWDFSSLKAWISYLHKEYFILQVPHFIHMNGGSANAMQQKAIWPLITEGNYDFIWHLEIQSLSISLNKYLECSQGHETARLNPCFWNAIVLTTVRPSWRKCC